MTKEEAAQDRDLQRRLKYVSNHYFNDKIVLTLPCMPFIVMIEALV